MMVDLETLAVSADAVILTIGAIAFDTKGIIKDKFYRRVDIDSCLELGLVKDDKTIQFWNENTLAKEEAFKNEDRMHIKDVIHDFTHFYLKNNAKYIWCLGANFDEPILSTVYKKLNIEKPWQFWNVRCLRTLNSLANINMKQFGQPAHHALKDCEKQILAYKSAMHTLHKILPM